MLIDSDALVSMRDANQNFSKVARLTDIKGQVVILKNNKPHFILMKFDDAEAYQADQAQPEVAEDVPDELVMHMAKQFADRYNRALTELWRASP
ncbi:MULTISPECIES: type II toxin-antitoxin system Phd/YefM family antitoxin [Trueperella]|uniref:Antitoxin n=1 Tax=Trueperella bernardiae TaxID=59561 RepID=A0A0W1KI62_9ACTO|nr:MULTISPECIES: type II toxin-antitoxin system Phd/YefM family antitoxin [Trueperella]KTF03691.1 prevent-host-death protein [Trueperella bernardiae]MCM3907538.1 type II toxin-antitoxin system Phd/YefM family antitoxin [Trueperella bernardiae]MDK8601786.1 type II toxin-antitoxin system Phd/YefM family antitoxin [Trueperella bernardiae]OCW60362.1 hypothetical protein AKG36_04205 [Trueperella bernardiae]OFS65539.1 hypothetical protein HMPREF3174_08115 [Trueperella sp. HMSC08H06]